MTSAMNRKIKIEIVNRQKRLAVHPRRIRTVLRKMLADAGIEAGYLEIVIMTDAAIHRLNVEYLGHDYATDVLSFEMEADPQRHYLEGNILVSSDTAVKRCKEFGQEPDWELLLYIIHGTLHLLGYDDHSEAEAPLMRKKEEEYMTFARHPRAPAAGNR
ncbi:MAG: rRNA maturation RNase YbeY [Planctomycetia bacterium]|nr:rRNA maturation RNase YbeY [Planctomycetia bacterium]